MLADHRHIVGYIHMQRIKWKTQLVNNFINPDHELLANKINEPENWNEIYESDNTEHAFAFYENTMKKLVAQSSYSKQIKQGRKILLNNPGWQKNAQI